MTARVPRPRWHPAAGVPRAVAGLLAACLTLAATGDDAQAPDGAFGLVFNEPVPTSMLGRPSAIVVARSPLGHLDRLHRDRPASMEPAWRDFTPPTVPAALRNHNVQFQVLLDEQRQPLRIRASAVGLKGQCPQWMAEVDSVLAARYADLPAMGTTRPGFGPSSVYGSSTHTVELACATDGDLGILEYTDALALQAWQLRERPRIEQWYASLLEEAMDLGPLGVRSVFGFEWGQPSPLARGVPDLAVEVEPPRPYSRLPKATYDAVFSPDGVPVMVRARTCPDSAAVRAHMLLFGDALRVYPGVLIKDTPDHVVLRVADDLLSLRLEADRCVNFAVTDGDAQRAMMNRRKEAKLATAERRERRMEAAQRGL